MLAANNKLKQQAQELKSWKLDASLFVAKWKEEPPVDKTTWENDLVLGNPDAPLQIIVACNPYCGPCAKAHKKLDEILETYPEMVNVKVRLLFRNEDKENILTVAAGKILAIAENNNVEKRKLLLSDWFEHMNLEKWEEKWKPNGIKVENKMLQHSRWIKNSGVSFTPTFFINGKRLPGRYSLHTLEKLITSLVEVEDMIASIPPIEPSIAMLD